VRKGTRGLRPGRAKRRQVDGLNPRAWFLAGTCADSALRVDAVRQRVLAAHDLEFATNRRLWPTWIRIARQVVFDATPTHEREGPERHYRTWIVPLLKPLFKTQVRQRY
jgi:hypothetical protein